MKGDKITSATLSSSVTLFLKFNYLQITTKYTKTLIFYRIQKNIQAQQKIFLNMSPPYTKALYGSTENINISTEATNITSSPSPFVSKY